MFFKDPRDYQILFLSLFLGLGIGTRDWTLRPELIIVASFTCVLVQWLCNWAIGDKEFTLISLIDSFSLRSPLITSLGLSLLLRAEHWLIIAIAAACAIASKFIFKYQNKHFFNPANFGIIAALVFTSDAWVSPGQWGEDWLYGMLFVGAGGMILQKVGRWDTTAAFLGAYGGLEAVRNIWLGWTMDVYLHRLSNGSLLLFALFMVTDPRSIPNSRTGRIIWAVTIAVATFILRNYFLLSTAVFWALFAIAPLTLLLDLIWSEEGFSWHQVNKNQETNIEVG
ncbi:MAG: RnfABCDGE type electron transport complex subunit D [Cyanobacteria bacterium P01_A01_bin.84]